MESLNTLLNKDRYTFNDLVTLLNLRGKDQRLLFEKAAEVKKKKVGNIVYFRGLIEFSNLCSKNCLYCGIRKDNARVDRYNLTDDEILEAVHYAHNNRFASVVLQSGEITSGTFVKRIDALLRRLHRETNGEMRITLSLGEQSEETYRRWYESGASRYLLRIETTNRELYQKIHPADNCHSFNIRMLALKSLIKTGYQTGTGVMIGLPFQTHEDLANDLLFMRDFGIHMVGMGPYLEHANTPLMEYRNFLLPVQERLHLTLRMIAILRILMPDINIAAATALQAIDKMGREKGIKAGANVIMPNITPGKYRDSYKLYENKPCSDENADDCFSCLEARIKMTGSLIGFGNWGDSQYYIAMKQRKSSNMQVK
jgi:biotin synthase